MLSFGCWGYKLVMGWMVRSLEESFTECLPAVANPLTLHLFTLQSKAVNVLASQPEMTGRCSSCQHAVLS